MGEAGVGKSRLLLEFRQQLSEDPLYLEGRCLTYGGSMTYLPMLDILRSYFEIQEGDREALIKRKLSQKITSVDSTLQTVLPPFHEFLSLKAEDQVFLQLEPRQKRERTFEALRDLFLRESQDRPVILVIEDLHWIDKTSEEFLGYLIDWLANAKILLLLLYRPEYRHPWGSKSYYSKIGLDQLSLPSSAELVAALLEGGEVAPELKELILTRAAGNPLFMEEFTSTLLENGTIRKEDNTYTLTRPASEIQVPDTIQGIISARMDRLEENLKRTMQVASVIGRDFAFRILQVITGMREELKSHLLNLQGLEFIYEKRLFPELEYIFKHALTQEVAYGSLLLQRRKEVHERIGQAIEQLYAERLEEFYEVLAYHYSRTDNLPRACHYLKLSGEKSMKNFATHEAFGFYQQAIELLRRQKDTEENRKKRLEILLLMMYPMRLLGYPEGSLGLLQEGERLSQEMEDQKSLAIFHSRMGTYFTIREGDPLLGVEYGERCWQEAQNTKDLELTARAGQDLCSSYDFLGKHAKIVDLAPQVLALLEEAGKEREVFGGGVNVYSVTLHYYGYSLWCLGDLQAGRAMLDQALSFAREMNDMASLGLIELHYGFQLAIKGDGKSAAEHLQNAIRSIEEVKFLIALGLAWTALGEAYRLMGEIETAKQYMEKGLKAHRDWGFPVLLSYPFLCLGLLYFDLGDLEAAREHLEQALRFSQQQYEGGMEAISRMWLGRTLAKAYPSQTQGAEGHIRQGIQMAEELKLKIYACYGYHFLGELCAARGEREKALETLKKAIGMYQEMGMDYWLTQAQAALRKLGEKEA